MAAFFQDAPVLPDPYAADAPLRAILRQLLAPEILTEIEPDLRRFAGRVIGDVRAMGLDAEARPPRLISFGAWGQRVDAIEVAAGWHGLHRAAAEEGLVALAYERAHGADSRLHQFAKLYLFHPSSSFYSCPLAMTDGAARVLETLGDGAQIAGAFRRLTSRDGDAFWTSGQWMTERTGGSDVGQTTTVARPAVGGGFELTGDKWFTSATTAKMALALARIEGSEGGSKGLSLFYLETFDGATGALRPSIQVRRLKEKLGTRALPTAELSLLAAPAELVGEAGGGVRKISALLNITRLHNSICAVASQARALALAKDYAGRRRAFGALLRDHPLHAETLADLQCEHEAGLHLTFCLVAALGREEAGLATPEERSLLRTLTPVTKLFTAKSALRIASEVVEAFGGAGYVEDTGLPQLVRDAQVFSIWEGTTNVLSLDVLRALGQGGFDVVAQEAGRRLKRASAVPRLMPMVARVEGAVARLKEYAGGSASNETSAATGGRAFAFSLARSFAAALLLEHAAWCVEAGLRPEAVDVAQRWCAQELITLVDGTIERRASTARILGI